MRLARLLTTLAAGLALAAPGAASAACKMAQIGEIPIVMRDAQPLIEATINGQKALLLFDTGAWFSTMSAKGAKRLGLGAVREDRVTSIGVGGEQEVSKVTTKELRLGSFVAKGAEFFVARDASLGEDVDGVIGQLYFSRSDVEVDLAHQVVRLFQPEGCGNGILAYWADAVAATELDPFALGDGELVATVLVNGKKLRAQFDTGAWRSVLALDRAVALGGQPNAPTTRDLGPLRGFGPNSLPAWSMMFESFSIGQEAIRNARLVVADLEKHAPERTSTGSLIAQKVVEQADMLVGADFFLSHRVYFARGQKRMYFTYNGGPVFNVGTASAKP